MDSIALARFPTSQADESLSAGDSGRQITTARLGEAIASMRDLQRRYGREKKPLEWAMLQNNVGNALRRLGEREGDSGRIEEAVTAYRAALEIYTRSRSPLEWAMTQNN